MIDSSPDSSGLCSVGMTVRGFFSVVSYISPNKKGHPRNPQDGPFLKYVDELFCDFFFTKGIKYHFQISSNFVCCTAFDAMTWNHCLDLTIFEKSKAG